MNKKKKGVAAWALLVVGAVMMLISLGNLLAARELLQYAVVPRGEMDAAVSQLLTVKREVADTLADCTSALAVGGVTEKASVSAGSVNQTCAVYAVGEGWFEADPVFLTAGRRLTETELKLGDKVAMVDEQLAFQLFGSELPEDAKATIDGVEYAVVGAYRHRRSVGEAAQYSAYVPLLSANQNARDELLFIAVPVANTGARTMFESTMRANWEQDGCFISIGKEALRQRMIMRMLLLGFGLSVIFRLMRRMNGAAARSWTRFQERLRWNYFRTAAPSLMAFLGICLLHSAAVHLHRVGAGKRGGMVVAEGGVLEPRRRLGQAGSSGHAGASHRGILGKDSALGHPRRAVRRAAAADTARKKLTLRTPKRRLRRPKRIFGRKGIARRGEMAYNNRVRSDQRRAQFRTAEQEMGEYQCFEFNRFPRPTRAARRQWTI